MVVSSLPPPALRILSLLDSDDPYAAFLEQATNGADPRLVGLALAATMAVDELGDTPLMEAEVAIARFRPGLYTKLQRLRRGLLVIFVGPHLADEELLEASRGAPFEHTADIRELTTLLWTLAKPRHRLPRRDARMLRLVLPATDADGFPGTHAVAEISTDEISFFAETGDDMERFLVGSILEPASVVVAKDGSEAVVDLSLQVRTVYLDDGRYRITASFGRPRGPAAPPPWQRQVLGWRCLALLRGALTRGEALTVTAEGDGHEHRAAMVVPASRVTCNEEELHFSGDLPFEALTPVVVSFRFRECLSRFTTLVLRRERGASAGLLLKLPSLIEEVDARRTVRHETASLAESSAELQSPLFLEKATGRVVDVGANGFRMRWSVPNGMPIPIGTVFDRVSLRIDGATLRGRAILRNLAVDDDDAPSDGGTLLGLSFEPDRASSAALPALFARLAVPGIVDGSMVTFENLLELFRGSHFLSEQMETLIAPLMPQSARTHEALRHAPADLFRAAAFRGEAEILAYISLVRGYRRTLVMQHHAALPGRGFGRRVQSGILQYLEGQSDYEYIRAFFFVGNAFPESRFGDFARKDHDPNAIDLRVFAHVVLPQATEIPPSPGVDVREATDADLERVERHVLATERGLLLRSEDLGARWLRLGPIHERFSAIGLERRRIVFVAHRDGVAVGAALLEWSSPGINLFEGFTTFRLFIFENGDRDGDEAIVRALLTPMLARVRAAGRPFLFGLVPAPVVERLPYLLRHSDHRSWSFTVRRDHLRFFLQHLLGP